ncbi:gamma-glutamyltransferase family protein [Brevibacterium aurantiacum]|uniref:Gamma-glutamyltranspeptidase / glutathione hydrolase n=1 Tax=Brevibacterium aurantiacum TaxID=273384 RepID=A0A2H1J204_BREAU|nr:gamma-glutamyltransferase [Brevibacterium aurantiacum]SMX81470.1 gamma-glutamyltranspeptidase / glutathione hydrolase [Brevibacterium aurantiacum]
MLLLLSGCIGPTSTDDPTRPDTDTGPACADQDAEHFMAVAANPDAAKAGCRILAGGGTAIDAAIAIQASLTVVEPQSSGLGGGALLTYYDSDTSTTTVFDGLSATGSTTTDSLTTPTRRESRTHGIDQFPGAVYRSSRAVGVPGVTAALDAAHKKYGRKAWNTLFDDSIKQAKSGFELAPGTANVVGGKSPIPTCSYPDIGAIFCDGEQPKSAGTTTTNPQLADLLEEIRDGGADAFYDPNGTIAPRIVARLQAGRFDPTDDDGDPAVIPSLLTAEDFGDYRAIERKPICRKALNRELCTAPPPSLGGTSLLNLLQIADDKNIGSHDMNSADYAQIMIESSRLSGVDGRTYTGDPAFDGRPPLDLASADYAQERAQSVHLGSSNHPVQPGRADGGTPPTIDPKDPQDQTSQIVVVDADGDALSMTTTVNADFGSRVMARGMILNNANGNFSSANSSVNEMEPGKRPRTTIAPTVGFDAQGSPRIVVGSAGGAPIHDYIAQAILGIETYDLSPAEALARPHLSGQKRVQNCDGQPDYASVVERNTAVEGLLLQLKNRGAPCAQSATLHSGTGVISVTDNGTLRGAADPRRDGAALGG